MKKTEESSHPPKLSRGPFPTSGPIIAGPSLSLSTTSPTFKFQLIPHPNFPTERSRESRIERERERDSRWTRHQLGQWCRQGRLRRPSLFCPLWRPKALAPSPCLRWWRVRRRPRSSTGTCCARFAWR